MLLLLAAAMASLITVSEWYEESKLERRRELEWAVCANLNNPYISTVILTCNSEISLSCDHPRHKLKQVRRRSEHRLTVKEALEIANQQEATLAIVHNLDICFTTSLRFLQADHRLNAFTAFFLSRHEFPNSVGLLPGQCEVATYQGSHDALVVRLPFMAHNLTYPLGQIGMEARIIWELLAMGYGVINPCRRYRSWHVHSGHERAWAPGEANLDGKSATAPPSD